MEKTKIVDKAGTEVNLNEIEGKNVTFYLSDDVETQLEGKVSKISSEKIWILTPERQKAKAYELRQVKMLELAD